MPPPCYHHNGFVATQALGHMMYGYTLLVPMSQRVLNKLSNERNISGHKSSIRHRMLHKIKMSIIYMLSQKQCALPPPFFCLISSFQNQKISGIL